MTKLNVTCTMVTIKSLQYTSCKESQVCVKSSTARRAAESFKSDGSEQWTICSRMRKGEWQVFTQISDCVTDGKPTNTLWECVIGSTGDRWTERQREIKMWGHERKRVRIEKGERWRERAFYGNVANSGLSQLCALESLFVHNHFGITWICPPPSFLAHTYTKRHQETEM